MLQIGIILILSGIIIIIWPAIIAYILRFILLFFGISMISASAIFTKKKKNNSENNYVKFGNYKIYKD
ncbi:hypothetical protein H3C61_03185 [Candidatus Gracilibacteria bacterium]|nr:hypothetical protein [Candidatus Gracilibacteria bacterium]